MRTVTTEDNPYKVAGDILFASSEVESDFRSVDLYGSSVRRKKEDAICSRFHLENESGTGDIAVYQTFPGMELVYNDMHMEYCNKMQSPRPGFIEINYCRDSHLVLLNSFLWHNTHSIISSFSRYISGALHIIHSSFHFLPSQSFNK